MCEFSDLLGGLEAVPAAQTAVAVECGQGTADDPYRDTGSRARTHFAPCPCSRHPTAWPSHIFSSRVVHPDRLQPCLPLGGAGTADHVADHMGGPFVHECHNDDVSVVRLTLPGRARQLQLKEVVLHVDVFESPSLPPSPLPPPPSPPPPAVNIGVEAAEDSFRTSLLNAVSEGTDGIAVRLQLSAGTHTLSEPIRLEASALRMSELFIDAEQGAVIDLQRAARRRHRTRRLSEPIEAAPAVISISGATTVRLRGLAFRGAANVSAIYVEAGAIVVIDQCEIRGGFAPAALSSSESGCQRPRVQLYVRRQPHRRCRGRRWRVARCRSPTVAAWWWWQHL